MTTRTSTRPTLWILVAIACLAGAVAVAVSASAPDRAQAAESGPSAVASAARTIRSGKLPFTFILPTSFKKKSPKNVGVGTSPLLAYAIGEFNLVDVRKAGDEAGSASQIRSAVQQSLKKLGFPGERGKIGEHSGLPMVAFNIDNRVSGTATNSRLYFFALEQRTWEIECQSTPKKRVKLLKGCRRAIRSIRAR